MPIIYKEAFAGESTLKQLKIWKKKTWTLTSSIDHPPHSADLGLCNFLLFSRLKIAFWKSFSVGQGQKSKFVERPESHDERGL